MERFTEQVIQIIRNIPHGKVMTYGDIARLAGSPRGARQVVRVLHTMSEKYKLPWHRVVNRKGEIALQDEKSKYEQVTRLESEGIFLSLSGRVDLQRFGIYVKSNNP